MHKFQPAIPPLPIFTGPAQESVMQSLAGLKQDKLLIGFAGRFVEEKGFDVLLRAIPIVLAQNPRAHFVFAGDTKVYYEKFFEYNQALIERNASALLFLGLLSKEDLFHFYRNLNVFVLCSRSDCFALTQAEAALCGVPLVVSDIPGARVLVRETGCGELVPSESPELLAQSILKVLAQPAHYQQGLSRVPQFLSSHATLPIN